MCRKGRVHIAYHPSHMCHVTSTYINHHHSPTEAKRQQHYTDTPPARGWEPSRSMIIKPLNDDSVPVFMLAAQTSVPVILL